MATINKVLYNISQVNDTSSTEKKQARDNIAASQVNYVSALGGTPTVTLGDLNVVTYQSGVHLNDGTGNIAPLAPEPVSGQTGQILTVTQTGVTWKPNQPKRDLFIQLYRNNSSSQTSTNVIDSIELPKVGDLYPSKVFGSFDCYPDDNCTTLAIVPMKSNNYGSGKPYGTGLSYDPYEDSADINVHDLLAMSNNVPGADGQYRNTVTFSFAKKDNIVGDIKYIGIKGASGFTSTNYHIQNMQIQCFYETEG